MTYYDTDEAYQAYLLKGVSRTFALTIPQLPIALYQVVGNGYLLCRIADTIEDEPALTSAQKSQFSQEFIRVVNGESCPITFSKNLSPLLSNNTLPTEKELILNTPRVIRFTHSFTPKQQATLSRCVRIMAEGMAEFQRTNSLAGLKNLGEMNRYCYHVAGVVGEMLTVLFCDYSPQIAQQQRKLQDLAISFGQGLQMTNILKDLWEDYQRGACWLPQDIFAQVGFDLQQLSPSRHDPAFDAGLTQLIGIARGHLYNALQYILLIPRREQGIRRFCLWALGMAILTLRRIHQHLDFSQSKEVKIPRHSVRATILVSNVFGYSNSSLQWLFNLLTHSLPTEPENFDWSVMT
jgi:farnesyl-diphosphate farnesyltransferase